MEESQDRERDVQKLAHELEHEAVDMERRSDELGSEIHSVREDFQHKRSDANVPGLEPDDAPQSSPPEASEARPSSTEAPPSSTEARPEDSDTSRSDPD